MTFPRSENVSAVEELLQHPLWLAPLAGVGDPVFRSLCRKQGAGLTYTEMVSAEGLRQGNQATWNLVVTAPSESRCAVQLFGGDPKVMASQASRVRDKLGEHLALIDMNMGCPVPKVTRRGEGGALMRDPERAQAIVSAVVNAVDVPVSVKFRRGWDNGSEDAVDFAARMEAAGAALLCIHGRSVAQLYRGPADWGLIGRVRAKVQIPCLGNGDVFSRTAAETLMRQTGVDGVLIARGAEGNPWVFSGVQVTPRMRVQGAREHMHGLCGLDPRCGVSRMRKHMAWYLAGLPNGAAWRARAMTCKTSADYDEMLDEVLAQAEELGCADEPLQPRRS